ncbi:MAG: SMP-30/gluconolactonase/LRE family protein [Opitutaceae bacterium]
MNLLNPGLIVAALAVMPSSAIHSPKGFPSPRPHTGHLESLSPVFDALVDPDAKIETLADGFDWSEGPVWIADGGYLLFSDIPPNNIWKWSEVDGLSLYLHPSGYTGTTGRGGEVGSNGLTLDARGRLVLCQHGDRRIARMTHPVSHPQPEYETLAATWQGRRFNSPNDLVYHPTGDLYFTDPAYGLEGRMEDPAKEIGFQGVYRLSTDGVVTLLTDEMTRPNGLAFSPDARTLYISNSDGGDLAVWRAYDVQPDGTLANGRTFASAAALKRPGRTGSPDGLKVDVSGNLFATGPGGVLVFSPQGVHLGTIVTGQPTSNCAWGDDGHTLYMTADMLLLRIRLKTRGPGFR